MKKGILASIMLVLGIALGVFGTHLFTHNSYENERALLECKMDQLCADMMDLEDIEISMVGMEDEYIKEYTLNENHSQAEWSRIGMNLETDMNERSGNLYRSLRNDITEIQPLYLSVETAYKKYGAPGDEALLTQWNTDIEAAKNLLTSVENTMQQSTKRYIAETEPLMRYFDSLEVMQVHAREMEVFVQQAIADSTNAVQ